MTPFDLPGETTAAFYEAAALGGAARLDAFLCDGYLLEGVGSLATLRDFLRQARPRHPGHRLLATLDQVGQAVYTSHIAREAHDLDATASHDFSVSTAQARRPAPAALGRGGGCVGAAAPNAGFALRRANLLKRAAAIEFPSIEKPQFWVEDEGFHYPADDGAALQTWIDEYGEATDLLSPEETHYGAKIDYGFPDFFGLNQFPDIAIDEQRRSVVMVVPVTRACETIAALPNGGFADHMTPMDLYRVAERFETVHGYELFGLGAACVGFERQGPMSPARAAALARDILAVFRRADDPALPYRVGKVIEASPVLLMHYAT